MCRHELADNVFKILPKFFKKLIKNLDWAGYKISGHQFHLLHFICMDNGKPMSYYSKKIGLPKPNLTVIADKLIDEGLIERALDPKDRRVVILKINEEGTRRVKEIRECVKNEIAEKFKELDDKEVERLNELFIEISTIMDKIK